MDSPLSLFSSDEDDSLFMNYISSIHKLNSTNYHRWIRDITHALRMKGLIKIVLGEEQPPPHEPGQDAELRRTKYSHRAEEATALLHISCEQRAKGLIVDVEDPHEMWTILKRMDSTTTASGRLDVYRRFQNTLYGEGGFSDFLAQLLDCKDALASSEEPIPDSLFKLRLLNQLPREIYGSTFTIMSAASREEQSLDHLLDALAQCNAIRKLQERLAEASHVTPTRPTNQRPGLQRGREVAHPYRGHTSRRANRARCCYCRRQGHREVDCRTKNCA